MNPLTIYNTNTTSDFKQMLSVVMDFEYDLPSEYGEYVFKDKVKKRVTKYINIVYIGVAVISITFGVLFYWFKCRPVKIKKRRIIRRQKNMISFRLLIQKH